jgi:hypothetical protein
MAHIDPKAPVPSEHRSLRTLIVVFIAAGLALWAWRHIAEPEAVAAPGDHLWDVELSIRAKAVSGQTSVEIAAPLNTRSLRVVGQNISHPAWRQSFKLQADPESSRRTTFVASSDGELSIHAVFSVHALAVPRLGRDGSTRPLEGDARQSFLRDHPTLQIDHPEVTQLVTTLFAAMDEGSSLPDMIFDVVQALNERTAENLLDVPEILSGKRANGQERAYTLVALSRAAHIPARLVKGLVLKESAQASLHFWAEVYQGGKWTPYDPVFGFRGTLPPNYLPFVKGIGDLVRFSGTASFMVDYAIVNTDPLLEVAASTHEDWREIFDLTRLPLDTRIVLAALMLLPFGALLTALFNEVIGVRSYGVFTPTLLALSLAYIPWQSASIVLMVVLLFGVIGRAVIPGELSRVPRLSVVLTLVALGIGASASLMDYFEIGFGGQLVLLPIVILASLVDRFHAVFDEQGLHTALYRLFWTLLLAALCIPIVQYDTLGHTMVRYPELHLITLAAILGLNLYNGQRLSQIKGFSWLNSPIQSKP